MNYLEKKKRAIMAVLQRIYSVIGAPPITLLKSLGKSLKDYLIYGNTSQNGTPSPTSPVEIESVGTKTNNLWDRGNTVISDSTTRSCRFIFNASEYDWVKSNTTYYLSEDGILYEDDTRTRYDGSFGGVASMEINYEDGSRRDLYGSLIIPNDGISHRVSVQFATGAKPVKSIIVRLFDYSSNPGDVFHGEARNIMLTTFNSASLSITNKSIDNGTVISDENNVYYVKGNDGYSVAAYSAGQVNFRFSPISTKNRRFRVSFFATRVSDGVWTNSSTQVFNLYVQSSELYTKAFYNYSNYPIGERVLVSSDIFTINNASSISLVQMRLNAMEWKIETDSLRIDWIDEDDLKYKPYGYEIPVLSHYQENLIPYVTANKVSNGVSFQTTGNNCIHLKGTATANVSFTIASPITLTAGNYVFYAEGAENIIDDVGIVLRSLVTTSTYYDCRRDGKRAFTLTTDENWRMYITIREGVTINTILNLYLEKGTDFPISTNIYLDEPLRKIGDFVDYIDFKNQKVVRQIKALNSADIPNNYWADDQIAGSSESVAKSANAAIGSLKNNGNIIQSFCTRFESTSREDLFKGVTGVAVNANHIRIYYPGITDVSLDDWKTWVANNPFTLNYVLETPVEQSVVLPEISTVKGTCVLDVRGMYPSNMNVKYLGK